MSDISAVIAQLPPGTDVFGFLSQMIVDTVSTRWPRHGSAWSDLILLSQVYPDLGRVFDVHVYL